MTVDTGSRTIAEEYYELIDSGQVHESTRFLSDDIKFTFANAEPVYGKQAVEDSIGLVLAQCTAIKHTIVSFFEQPGDDGMTHVSFELRIRYDLTNGTVLELPGAGFATLDAEGRFIEERLYGDLNPVFAG